MHQAIIVAIQHVSKAINDQRFEEKSMEEMEKILEEILALQDSCGPSNKG